MKTIIDAESEEIRMKKTFLFIYKNMQIGGIETYLIRLIRKLKELKHRIIWLTPKDRIIDDGFKQDLLDGQVEVVDIHINGLNWIRHKEIAFAPNEEVIALAFDPVDFLRLETLKKSYSQVRIDNFYWVPHFAGKAYFLEEFLPNPLRLVCKKLMKSIIQEMENNNNIFYNSRSHMEAYKRKYKLTVKDERGKLFDGTTFDVPPYDEELVKRRSLRQYEFNIISVGRFEFPHKAYFIGLIREYGNLKKKYKTLKLTIVGYGIHEQQIRDEINRLYEEAKNDVCLVGKVPFDDLQKFYRNSHLNIGVAGTIPIGALTGLISIPVRHYSETCEGYGFLPEAKDFTTSDKPGEPIAALIEKVINMSGEDYLHLSRKAYESYANCQASILSILNLTNIDATRTISSRKIFSIHSYVSVLKVLRATKHRFVKLFPYRNPSLD